MQVLKQELNIPAKITEIVLENVESIKKLQASIQTYNQKISDVMTGFCLSNGIDLEKDPIQFSEDFKQLKIFEKEELEISENEEKPQKAEKAKKVKI